MESQVILKGEEKPLDPIPEALNKACEEMFQRCVALDPNCKLNGMPSYTGSIFRDLKLMLTSYGHTFYFMVWLSTEGKPVGTYLGAEKI